jgi:hypothetical protein
MSRYQQHRRRDAALEVATQAEADAIVALLGRSGIRATTFSTGLGGPTVTLDWAEGVKVIVAPEDRAAALDVLDAAAGPDADGER